MEGFFRAKRVFAVLSSGRMAEPSDIDMFHGAAPDVIALALQKVIPQLSYDSRHLVFALFGVAGIYYLYRFGSKFVSEWTGVFAALFLAATPMWFGYMFINHKDIPFATLLLAASYYSLLALTGQPASSRFWVKTGLALGLFAATKLVGLLLLAFVVVVYLASLAIFPSQKSLEVPPDVWRRAARLGSAGALGCLIAFLLFWPQFYFGDIAGPGGSQGVSSTLNSSPVGEEMIRITQSGISSSRRRYFYWASPQPEQLALFAGRSLPFSRRS